MSFNLTKTDNTPGDDHDLHLFCLESGLKSPRLGGNTWSAVFTNVDNRLWENGQTIVVGFCDGKPVQHQKVIDVAQTWENLVNLKFEYVSDITAIKTHIRISFEGRLNSSLVGKQEQVYTSVPLATMNLASVTCNPNSITKEEQRAILHEWGHVLGLHHEHQNPALVEKGLVFDLNECLATFDFDEEGAKLNIINPLERNYTNFTEYDALSIMTYAIPRRCYSFPGRPHTEIYMPRNYKLSRLDKAYMSLQYPKPQDELIFKQALLTLQIPKEVSQDWDTTNTRQKFWLYHNQLRSPNLCIFVDEPEDSGSVPSGTYEIRTQTNLWSFESDSRIMRHESHFAPFGARLKEKAQDLAWVLPDLFLSSNAAEKLAALNEFVAAMAQDIGVRNMEFKAVLREFLQCPDIIA